MKYSFNVEATILAIGLKLKLETVIEECQRWLQQRHISDVVVGYSGGIDSALTTVLLGKCGLQVHLVIAESPNQKYSSTMGGVEGARALIEESRLKASIHELHYNFMFKDDAANEAAAPIQRVAGFYGICARLRADGRNAIVIGTANFDEAAYLGFWGKASDAAQDFYPISHLHKSKVYSLAKQLSVPAAILNAIPSGDLLFCQTNDQEMIGATYDQIEAISTLLESNMPERELKKLFLSVSSPIRFCKQIVSNRFKYDLPFSGFHLSDRLEVFRTNCYPAVLQIANSMVSDV